MTLLRDWLKRQHSKDADWVRIVLGPGGRTYFLVNIERFEIAAERLPRCCRVGCERPALRENGGCGSCRYGHPGRPQSLERQRQAIQAVKELPGVITLGDVATQFHVSAATPYLWRRKGLLDATRHYLDDVNAYIYFTDASRVTELKRSLARRPSIWLLEEPRVFARAHATGRLNRMVGSYGEDVARLVIRDDVKQRRSLILPHRAGAKRKDHLKAEWRRLFYTERSKSEGWSDFEVCVSVAELHIRTCANPAVWGKYERTADGDLRAEDRRKAAQRIWAAVR